MPDHLLTPMWAWFEGMVTDDSATMRDLGIHLRMVLPNVDTYAGSAQAMRQFADTFSGDRGLMLDAIEFLLERFCDTTLYRHRRQEAKALENLLDSGNSLFRVKDDLTGLEMRAVPEVQQQVQAVVDSAKGSAGDHLADAWNQAYGRSNDPVKSYSESIKAVEASLAPVVSSKNLKATLGTMIGEVRSNPSLYQFAIAEGATSHAVQTVLGLMQVLWEGQTSRHGGVKPTRHETVEEAQAAVHIAATLVQWATSGAFSRR